MFYKLQPLCKTPNKAVTVLILREVRCICNELKLPLNTELETTVTFVNRDGKTGNYKYYTAIEALL
jgi:hypothetical protein